MQFLVSVRDADEAKAALRGGAQIVDAKEPVAGGLGPVSPEVLRAIREAVPSSVPLSAAGGDVRTIDEVAEALGRIDVRLSFVKLGFSGVAQPAMVERLLSAAVKLAGELPGLPKVIATAYGDWQETGSLDPESFPAAVGNAGAHGLLIDTAGKNGPRLLDYLKLETLAAIGVELRRHRLLFAVAGSLAAEDVPAILRVEADVVGVRGAATVGGRNGRVDQARVRAFASALGEPGSGEESPAVPGRLRVGGE